jgi:ATP-dependent Zn protease
MDHNDLLCTAIHEAGHAVIARVLGLSSGSVTIKPSDDGEELGHAVVGDPVRDWQRGEGPRRPLMEDHVVTLYAGGEAEREILASAVVGDGPDFNKARSCICQFGVRGATFVGDEVWEKYEERLRKRAALLVQRHRKKIERVAQALVERGILTFDEVNALMGD